MPKAQLTEAEAKIVEMLGVDPDTFAATQRQAFIEALLTSGDRATAHAQTLPPVLHRPGDTVVMLGPIFAIDPDDE